MARIEEEMKTKFAHDKHRMLANIVYTGNWITSGFVEFVKPFGLSSPQFNILRILRGAKDWLSMNEMKERMVEKSPNTTRLCDKLEEKQLLERLRFEEDRRVVQLRITETGLKLLKDIDDQDDGSYIQFTNNVTDEEAKQLSAILDKLRG
jgi:DNA-binding MarR family transcriptional regulator